MEHCVTPSTESCPGLPHLIIINPKRTTPCFIWGNRGTVNTSDLSKFTNLASCRIKSSVYIVSFCPMIQMEVSYHLEELLRYRHGLCEKLYILIRTREKTLQREQWSGIGHLNWASKNNTWDNIILENNHQTNQPATLQLPLLRTANSLHCNEEITLEF